MEEDVKIYERDTQNHMRKKVNPFLLKGKVLFRGQELPHANEEKISTKEGVLNKALYNNRTKKKLCLCV